MSRARDLADLLDASGDVKSAALDNVPPSNDASALTTGTLDMARVANGSVTNAHFASGAADLSHDTTPQLGGALDAQSNNISNTGVVTVGTNEASLFNAEGTSANLTVAGSDTSTTRTGNGGAAVNIVQTNGTAGNTAGLHFSRQDTDGTPNYAGASIVAQFPDAQATGQYPKGRLAFLTSTTANAAPVEKMRLMESGRLEFQTPTATTGTLAEQRIDWRNENNAGVMASIGVHREAGYQAPSALVFRTSTNVDSAANNSDGDISEKMRISSGGIVTMPNQPAFDVSAVPTSHATNQVVDFVTVNTNIGNCWNNTTNRFVAPVSGMYQFNISVFTHRTTNQGDYYWDLRKNQNIILRLYDSKEGAANRHCQVMGSHAMYMAANDYADIFFVTSPGGVAMEASGSHNRFSGYLIG